MTQVIGDVIAHAIGGGWGSDEPSGDTTPVTVIRGADFPNAHLQSLQGAPLRHEISTKVHQRTLQAGDIVLEISGGTKDRPTGRTVLITERILDNAEGPIIPASFCRLVRIDGEKADPRFIYHVLQQLHADGGTWEFQNQSTGLSNFQFGLFRSKFRYPALPLSQQRGIAEVLGALDDKIAANADLARAGASLTSTHYDWARQQASLGPAPLRDLVSTQYGVTTSATTGDGPRLLRVTDINKQPWIEWSGAPACVVDDSERAKYGLADGDILVARMADPGKAAFIDAGDPDAVFASYLVRLKAHNPELALYIYYFLRSSEYQAYAEGASSGSVQRNMNAKVIVGTDISVPAESVVHQFNGTVRGLRATISSHLNENIRLATTRDALLPQLMSGKITVKDAERVAEGAV